MWIQGKGETGNEIQKNHFERQIHPVRGFSSRKKQNTFLKVDDTKNPWFLSLVVMEIISSVITITWSQIEKNCHSFCNRIYQQCTHAEWWDYVFQDRLSHF